MEYVIQLNTLQIAIVITAFGILQFLISNWIRIRLERSIQHSYDKQLEQYKYTLAKREKIANIARFFAHWVKYRGNEAKWLSEKEQIEYFEELTRMSFELTLWVDDEDFIKNIMKRLRNEDGSTDTVSLLLEAKKLLSDGKSTGLENNDITLWPADTRFISRGPSKK